MMDSIIIGQKKIGENHPVFTVAELSANHGQKYKIAVDLIREAKNAGVDAIKMQAYTPDTLTLDADNKYFQIKHPKWGGQTLYELYKKAYTPWEWFKPLKKIANDLGLIFFATAYNRTAVDFLEDIDVPIHKIASPELVDLPLIEYIAKTKKPLFISTGMATLEEIEESVKTARNAGIKKLVLLKCTSSYPAKPEEMNLKTIPHMKKTFKCPIGLSDHSLGLGVSIAAVSLGAQVIEKHFTLSRDTETPDSFFSLEPAELKEQIENIREAQKALGKINYKPTNEEKQNRVFRRSLFAVSDIKKGEIFTEQNVRSVRPGYGLLPKYLKDVLGKRAARSIKKGTPLTQNLIQ